MHIPKTRIIDLTMSDSINFGLFHMIMNFIQLIFNELYDSKSVNEIGTLKFLQDRIWRASVNADVRKAYDPDKEFVLAVKAVMHHFGVTNYSDMS